MNSAEQRKPITVDNIFDDASDVGQSLGHRWQSPTAGIGQKKQRSGIDNDANRDIRYSNLLADMCTQAPVQIVRAPVRHRSMH